jgi:predicted NBD/HSP70 family sugar kinase
MTGRTFHFVKRLNEVDDHSGSPNSRRLNRQRLLEAVRRSGPISRADLAKATRLSPPTVSALVEDLLHEAGLMHEVGVGTSKGGRPPILLQFNGEFGYLVGIDVGSRVLRVALADLQGQVLARHQVPTDPAGGPAIVDQVCAVVDEVFDLTGRDRRKLYAVGVGAPGMTNVQTGRVIRAVNLPGWVDLPLRDLLQARLDAPVRVDNDANMAALGERWQGSARRVNDFVFLALGAGVGAGIVVGGRLHRGHHWYAGEISHMNLDFREWQSDFGARGYLESHVGAADFCDVRPEVLDQLAVYLGTAVANIVAVLDPALVVLGGLGGELGDAGELLLEPVRRVVSRIVPNLPSIELSSLGDDAQLVGAVYSAMETAEGRLAAWLGATRFPSRAAGRTGTR